MPRNFIAAILLAFAGLAAGLAQPAFGQGESWKLLTPSVAANVAASIRIQLVDKGGKPVARPLAIASVRADMSPDNMGTMTAPARSLPSKEPGVVVVETTLTAPGRWAITLSGSAGGLPAKGTVIVTATAKSAQTAPPPAVGHRIVYYRNPMGLADTSPLPRKDPMGMDYIPVYADEIVQSPGAIHLDNRKIQRSGVRTVAVSRMVLAKSVRATGIVAPDESRQSVLAARFNGFVEKLFVTQTGDSVRQGQPLMRVWIESPEVLIKEADYVGSLASGSDANANFAASVLRQFGVPQSELDAMAKSGTPTRAITIAAPSSGIVMEKLAVNGMRFSAGDPLFKITDISLLWVLAGVSERDLATVNPGQKATINFQDDPSASFVGKVLFVYPDIDAATRTVKVRIALANPRGRLRIGQYADVRIDAPVSAAPVLAVPVSAVVDDGSRQIAFVAEPDGSFAPRQVSLGARSGDTVEVRAGLKEGERIVATGNFLIDAESNLETALQSLAPGQRP